ncbi:Uncharacterised protein [Mycobacterium tuberculosis]|nr:Uncharacterised protein [Mycobacterium tuberculosis]
MAVAVRQRGGRQIARAVPDFLRPSHAEAPGRQRAATPFGVSGVVGVQAAEHVAQHPLAHRPLGQGVDLDRYRVLDGVDVPGQRVVQRPEEPLDRILEEVEQVRQRHVGRGWCGQPTGDESRWWTALPGGGLGGGERGGVERERLGAQQCAGGDVLPVERLQWVCDQDPLTHRR